jgi:hypothetical protein
MHVVKAFTSRVRTILSGMIFKTLPPPEPLQDIVAEMCSTRPAMVPFFLRVMETVLGSSKQDGFDTLIWDRHKEKDGTLMRNWNEVIPQPADGDDPETFPIQFVPAGEYFAAHPPIDKDQKADEAEADPNHRRFKDLPYEDRVKVVEKHNVNFGKYLEKQNAARHVNRAKRQLAMCMVPVRSAAPLVRGIT